jgi:hypothetical protein
MPLLRKDVSKDGFEIRFYDYKTVENGNRRFFLWFYTMRGVGEKWNVYTTNPPDLTSIANEFVEELKFEGIEKTFKTVGERTPSITSLTINGRLFEMKRASVDFAEK